MIIIFVALLFKCWVDRTTCTYNFFSFSIHLCTFQNSIQKSPPCLQLFTAQTIYASIFKWLFMYHHSNFIIVYYDIRWKLNLFSIRRYQLADLAFVKFLLLLIYLHNKFGTILSKKKCERTGKWAAVAESETNDPRICISFFCFFLFYFIFCFFGLTDYAKQNFNYVWGMFKIR